ncbi:GntR family transcriptional regulator [Arthrobacter sp. H5]|uniref:GntR family transcriptional regulator n=1 Tax=Arthrobacter sp. H5 TaxID=1267973 RepID=UPI0004B9EB92|nr:GntR family transcriptional regulator [Arthrobacter sp. H5]
MNSAAGDERPVNPSSAIPLHLQLRSHLRAQIVNHSMPPGTPLPSEAQLQDQFGVSRSVVRQALGALAAEGLIDRGRGRGSTVAPRREHHRLIQRIPGLSTQIAETGVSVETEILAFSVEAAHGSAAVLGTTEVLALKRLRSVDGSPIALIHTWLPLPLCRGLTAEDLRNASLHAVLREKFGIDITAGRRQIRAAPADADLLALLRMEAHSPVLLLEGTSVDATGRTVEAFTTWHHADQVVFDIDVVNDGNSAPMKPPTDRTLPDHGTVGAQDSTALTLAVRAKELGRSLEQLAEDLQLLGKNRT